MASDSHDPTTVKTIEALLSAEYGEPTFAERLVAMHQRERDVYSSVGAGAGGLYDWLVSAASTQTRIAPHEIRPEHVAAVVAKTTDAADTLLQTSSIRRRLCTALTGASNDVFDIAKVITPVLTGASLAGTVAIGTPVLLYAVISLIIARAGIASFCRGVDK